jgi:hypothetical protein
MFQESPIQKILILIGVAGFLLGFVVITRLEMKLGGLKFRELGKAKSGWKPFFCRTGNAVIVWALAWPKACSLAKQELKYRQSPPTF